MFLRCWNWLFFSCQLASFVVLSIQIQNINLRFMRLIIKRNAQKQMSRSSFVCKFHDLNYLELGLFFHIPWLHYTLEVIINYFYFLFYVENHQFNVNLISYLRKTVFQCHHLLTHLLGLVKHVDLILHFFVNINCLAL